MKIGFSTFARARHKPGTGNSWFKCGEPYIINQVLKNWDSRVKGDGECTINDVCTVTLDDPLVVENFVCSKVHISKAHSLGAWIERRQTGEDEYVRIGCEGEPLKAKLVKIVLYSQFELLKNDGKRSGDFDWEIVSIIATDDENEPMQPLTMARNFLEKDGGTPREYTAHEFADAIWYWSQYMSPYPINVRRN